MTPSPLDSADAVQGDSPEPPIRNYNLERRFAWHNQQRPRIGAILPYKFATGVCRTRTKLSGADSWRRWSAVNRRALDSPLKPFKQ
jgi:hypothetical protein